jgi:hypothetical protein
MKFSHITGSRILGLAIVAGLVGVACSSNDDNKGTTSVATGGKSSVTAVTGGKPAATGGAPTTTAATGGKPAATGGAPTTTAATGGTTSTSTDATGGVATGGTSSTGTVAVCESSPSTYSETATFTSSAAAPSWNLNTNSSQTGSTYEYTTTSPAGSTICQDGCGVLSFSIPAGTGWGGGTIVDRWFASPLNLFGNSVKAQVALEVDAASASKVVVQLFAQGGSATNYAWGSNATATSSVADTTAWHDLSLAVANTGSFCASNTGAVGLIVQRNADTTTDIPVKLYIKSVVIGSTTSNGTGGTSGTGGSAGTTGGSTSTSTDATGGTTSAGGASSTAVACGTTKSTASSTQTFSTSISPWAVNDSTATAASATFTTTSPASNATLCDGGCGAFSYAFAAATAAWTGVQFVDSFATPQNLLGATITVSLAVDNPNSVPVQVQLFASGGEVGSWGWSNISTITSSTIAGYAASTGFKDLTLTVADSATATQSFCGSDAHSFGIQLQSVAATPASASTVTVYVQKVIITPAA